VKRAIVLLYITSLILSACVSSPPIWGVVQTPTPPSFNPLPLQTNPVAVSVDPSPTPGSTNLPGITTEDPPFLTPTPPAGPFSEPTYTPTFDTAPVLYYVQSGDSLAILAKRFNVKLEEITSDSPLPPTGLIDPGTLLVIPDRINEPTTPNIQIMPDNEIIFSATAVDFDLESFVQQAGGHLSKFREYLGSTGWVDGDKAIARLDQPSPPAGDP
jgi:hypothetical protein